MSHWGMISDLQTGAIASKKQSSPAELTVALCLLPSVTSWSWGQAVSHGGLSLGS